MLKIAHVPPESPYTAPPVACDCKAALCENVVPKITHVPPEPKAAPHPCLRPKLCSRLCFARTLCSRSSTSRPRRTLRLRMMRKLHCNLPCSWQCPCGPELREQEHIQRHRDRRSSPLSNAIPPAANSPPPATLNNRLAPPPLRTLLSVLYTLTLAVIEISAVNSRSAATRITTRSICTTV